MLERRDLAWGSSTRQIARGRVETQVSALDEPACAERGVLMLDAVAAQRHVETFRRKVDHATAELGLDVYLRVDRDERAMTLPRNVAPRSYAAVSFKVPAGSVWCSGTSFVAWPRARTWAAVRS